MRQVNVLSAAALAVMLSGPVFAQAWGEFTDRAEFFTINMPGDPKVETITYKTEKDTSLPAKVYSGADARGGRYKLTVVNYASAPGEGATAIAERAKAIRAQGEVKYDNAAEHQNNVRSERLSVILPDRRQLLAEVMLHKDRFYILEADTPGNVPPPAQFQASLMILDDSGVALRYRNPESTERVR